MDDRRLRNFRIQYINHLNHQKYAIIPKMYKLFFSTLRNIGLGIFVNGAFALQFGDLKIEAYIAIAEGILIMFFAGYAELKEKK